MPGPTHQVANPPSKTLLVYDGDCGFCKLWIARWREITAGAVDYEELQDAAARFPEVPRAAFEHAVKLIETDGRVFSGAEAVYRSLGKGGGSGFGRWAFEHVPGFAPISNFAYAFIARHRDAGAYSDLALLGQRCPAPHLFPRASLVLALPRR